MNLPHEVCNSIHNALSPAEMGRVARRTVIDLEAARLRDLQANHTLLVLARQRLIFVQNQVGTRERRVGVIGELGRQDGRRSERGRPLLGDLRVEVVEEELFGVGGRGEAGEAVFLSEYQRVIYRGGCWIRRLLLHTAGAGLHGKSQTAEPPQDPLWAGKS